MDRRSCTRIALLFITLVMMSSCVQSTFGPAPSDQATRSDTSLPKPGTQTLRLAADSRQAIVQESFFALDPGHYGRSSLMISGNNVGDWAYMSNDMNAYGVMKAHYGVANSSVWEDGRFPSFFSDPSYYAYMKEKYTSSGAFGSFGTKYGRGAQCRLFANLILYRCEAYWDNNRYLYSYATYRDDFNGSRRMTKPIGQVQIGDVIQTLTTSGHTAIVVQIMARDAGGNVSSVDVIDSNYVGGMNNEIIGRHVISSIPLVRDARGVVVQNGNGGLGDLDCYIALNLNYR